MNTYNTLNNRYQVSRDFFSVTVLAVDYSNSYWDMNERTENACETLSDLDKCIEIGDDYYDVIWTQKVLAELEELASEFSDLDPSELVELNSCGLELFAPDTTHASLRLGELMESAGTQITQKGGLIFYRSVLGYSECVGNVISESTPITPSNLECIYPQLPAFFIQTYRYRTQNIHIVHYVYNNSSALYAFIASNVSEHGDRALCHHLKFSMFNLNAITSVTQISAKFFRAMLANPVPTKHNF